MYLFYKLLIFNIEKLHLIAQKRTNMEYDDRILERLNELMRIMRERKVASEREVLNIAWNDKESALRLIAECRRMGVAKPRAAAFAKNDIAPLQTRLWVQRKSLTV